MVLRSQVSAHAVDSVDMAAERTRGGVNVGVLMPAMSDDGPECCHAIVGRWL